MWSAPLFLFLSFSLCLFFSKSSVSLSFYAFGSSFKHLIVSFIKFKGSPLLCHNNFDLSFWTKDNLVSLLSSWKVQAELPLGFGWFLQLSINQGPRSPGLWHHLSCVYLSLCTWVFNLYFLLHLILDFYTK